MFRPTKRYPGPTEMLLTWDVKAPPAPICPEVADTEFKLRFATPMGVPAQEKGEKDVKDA